MRVAVKVVGEAKKGLPAPLGLPALLVLKGLPGPPGQRAQMERMGPPVLKAPQERKALRAVTGRLALKGLLVLKAQMETMGLPVLRGPQEPVGQLAPRGRLVWLELLAPADRRVHRD